MRYLLVQICDYTFDHKVLIVDENKHIIVFESKADANDFIEKSGEDPESIMIIPEMEFI